jgi:hypothetical protein
LLAVAAAVVIQEAAAVELADTGNLLQLAWH